MYEIEMKAHVLNPGAVRERLEAEGEFLERVSKKDVYYKSVQNPKIQARIRSEEFFNSDSEKNPFGTDSGGKKSAIIRKKTVLTYKKKESRIDGNGSALEVNEELESEVSDPKALETLFLDLGMEVSLRKTKEALGFALGNAHAELCRVPPLGDFLEVEVLSEKNDANSVQQAREEIKAIFRKCGIQDSQIESRYYSEMLKGIAKDSLKEAEKNV